MNFNSLVREHGPRVFNLAFRITGNRHDAEDVMQETFLQVHRNLDKFRGEAAVFTWIYRIAVNCSLQTKRMLTKAYIDSLKEKHPDVKKVMDSQEAFTADYADWRDARGGVAAWPYETFVGGQTTE